MQIVYQPRESFFHKIDPLMKFLWAFIVAVWLYSLRDVRTVLVVSIATAVFSVVGAKLAIKHYAKIATIVFIGGGFLMIFQGIFRPGPGIQIGFIGLSYDGMKLGLAIGLRVFGLVASSLAISVSTSPQDLRLSMLKMGMPYNLAHIGYLSLRLLPIFERDIQTIQDIQDLRGVKRSWARTRATIVALIATELRHADDITIALETRGFGLHKTRTEMRQVTVSRRGILLTSCTFALMIFQKAWENLT